MTRPVRTSLSVLCVLAAVVAHLALQAAMMLRWSGWNLGAFRNYFWSDQLSYLSIVTGVADGQSWLVEPFTLTGTNHYPRAWYVLLGTVARWTGTSSATVWTVGGLLAQCLLVAAIATACVLLTRRWWAGLLGFLPFLLGTGSWFVSDSWMTLLDSHAVLWGPFGVMFTLNGETVALSLGGTALILLLLVAAGRIRGRAAWVVAVLACFVVGALAAIQTYSFFVVTFTLLFSGAAVGLVRSRSRAGAVWSAALLVLVLVAGPVVGREISQLSVLLLAVVPAAPGLLLLGRALGWRVLWCVGALGVGAAPQILATAWGLLQEDPFLVYREASSTDLGVPWTNGLVAAAGVLPALALVVVAGVRRRRTLWVAVPSALALLWVYLATNDLWGAGQEPYRFWLDMYVLVAVLVVPLLAWVVVEGLSGAVPEPTPADRPVASATADPAAAPAPQSGTDAAADGEPGGATSATPAGAAPAPWPTRDRQVLAGATVVALVVAAVWSVSDFRLFREGVTSAGYVTLAGDVYLTAGAMADERGDDLTVMTDACLDPTILKGTWPGPVAFYNRGMAWPDRKADVDAAMGGIGTGELDTDAALRAGIGWLLVDRDCSVPLTEGDGLTLADERTAGTQTIQLWRIEG